MASAAYLKDPVALLLGGLVVARPGVGRHAQPLGVHEGQGEVRVRVRVRVRVKGER